MLTAFGALSSLNSLHARVRRNTIEPSKPETILARHFQAGQADQLPNLLAALVDDLEEYDQGLRRYPVVFYFHTRRLDRSMPVIFMALGQLTCRPRCAVRPLRAWPSVQIGCGSRLPGSRTSSASRSRRFSAACRKSLVSDFRH